MRQIALVNETSLLGPEDVERCAAALQMQLTRDFAPTWGIDAQICIAAEPALDEEILYVCDDAAQADALGLGRRENGTRPAGFALVRPCLENGRAWQVAVSHELLEMLADPLLTLSAQGGYTGIPALYALDICDPVDADEYEIAGLPVANFVLPTWFLSTPLPDELLVDFLGRLAEPFILSPCGHASYCIELGRWQQCFARRCPKTRRSPGAYSRRRRRASLLPR